MVLMLKKEFYIRLPKLLLSWPYPGEVNLIYHDTLFVHANIKQESLEFCGNYCVFTDSEMFFSNHVGNDIKLPNTKVLETKVDNNNHFSVRFMQYKHDCRPCCVK